MFKLRSAGGGRMSEYVVELNSNAVSGGKFLLGSVYLDAEEIVRCRDCDYYDHWEASGTYREKHVCGYWDYLEINPDGFCAWGERKENGR